MHLIVLTAEDVNTAALALTPAELMSLMALVFVRLSSRSRINMPLRSTIATSAYSALFMPAHLSDFGTSMKVVTVPKAPSAEGLPASTMLLNEDTGVLEGIVNARSLTALRNAAGSALATRLIGPSSPSILMAFGAGRQIEAHIDLFIRSFPSLTKCVIVNRRANERVESLRLSLQSRNPFVEINVAYAIDGKGEGSFDLENAVLMADIICTATPSNTALFRTDWVKAGAHINLIGSYTPEMAEIETSLMSRARKILVESREACLKEAGEVIQAGIEPQDLVEIGEIVEQDGTPIKDKSKILRSAGDVTIFKSVGIGLQDTAISRAVLEKALVMGLGSIIRDYD